MWILNNADSAGIIPEENPFSMREVTLGVLATMSNRRNNKTNRAIEMRESRMIPALKSLDILRQNVQPLLNNDVDAVVKKYLNDYLMPGVNNIRSNFGVESITEAHIRELCCNMLDETKQLYSDHVPFCETIVSSNDEDDSYEENTKHTADEMNHGETIDEMTDKQQEVHHQQHHVDQSASSVDNVVNGPKVLNKFDSSRINENTFFVMSTSANKVLNCSRNRLFTKYPQLFRYTIDEEDRAWLLEHNIHCVTNSTPQNRSYMLLLEDVRSLLDRKKNDQCHDSNSNTLELISFKLPLFILQKVRKYMDKIVSFVNKAQYVISRPSNRSVYGQARSVKRPSCYTFVDSTDNGRKNENRVAAKF